MAENIEMELVQPKPIKFYNLTQEPPTVYVEAWQLVMGASDIKIKLGDITDQTDDSQVARHAFTVAMTHASFVDFVGSLNKIAEFLITAYGGDLPTTGNLPAERITEISDRFGVKSLV